jgi:hypothetical protein
MATTITCPEGVTMKKNEPCPACGANQHQSCIRHKQRLAKNRAAQAAKRAADRAEARRTEQSSP